MPHSDNEEIQVMIPYSKLVQLLEAPQKVMELQEQLKHHNRLIGALRGQLIEVIDKLKEK